MTDISVLIYTHSEYSFLWNAIIPLIKKNLDDEIQVHWLCNHDIKEEEKFDIPTSWIRHYYEENDIWTLRVGKCLKNINDEFVLFLHEDWLPIGRISKDVLVNMTTFMKSQECSFLLSYSHISRTSSQKGIYSGYENYYFYKENNHIFQPAIWKKSVFFEFCNTLKKHKKQNEDKDCLNFMRSKNCWSVQNKETVTTIRTKNSLFFPHMHAVSQGLWNFKKYPDLKIFLENFDINTDTRGIHTWWELDTQ